MVRVKKLAFLNLGTKPLKPPALPDTHEAGASPELSVDRFLTAKLAEALPYYERILKEFETSEYLENAKKRIAEIKTTQ